VEEEELGEGEGAMGDDHTTITTGSIIEGGGVLCMNRRQTWTIMVYLMTLLPSLIVSDIGPVLSLTGAVGGSCISYIGPGLVYLGVNGESFLNMVGSWVDRWRRKRGYATSSNGEPNVSENELPVEGNASLGMSHDAERFSYESIVSGSKPIWYYLGLFHMWTSIANKGSTSMRKKIEAADIVAGRGDSHEEKELLPPPSKRDFSICLFFILFGVMSAVVGVVSNVWVQLYNLDA